MSPDRLRIIIATLYPGLATADQTSAQAARFLAADIKVGVRTVWGWLADRATAGHHSVPAPVAELLEMAFRHAYELRLWEDRPADVVGLLFERLDALMTSASREGLDTMTIPAPPLGLDLPLTMLCSLHALRRAVSGDLSEGADSIEILTAMKARLEADCGFLAPFLASIVDHHSQSEFLADLLLREINLLPDAIQISNAMAIITGQPWQIVGETLRTMAARVSDFARQRAAGGQGGGPAGPG